MSILETMERRAEEFVARYAAVREQIGRVIVGHDEIVHGVLTCLFVGGHCLLEGVPGLGKTLLVRTLAKTLDLEFSRIQFTPDLMPADILGTNMVLETAGGKRFFEFQRGPIFTQICLADEINRATPKTQSAMLETMQEGSVTAAGTRYQLQQPFLVMATQNPIEQEGTYPLPEAQLDRFFFKLLAGYSDRKELGMIVDRTTCGETYRLDEPFFVLATQNPIEQEGTYPLPTIQQDRFMFSIYVDYLPKADEIEVVNSTTSRRFEALEHVMTGADLLGYQRIVREIPVADPVARYAVRLAGRSRPGRPDAPAFIKDYVSWGAGPRACQYLILGGKVRAVLYGRFHVSTEDIQAVAKPVLRHRIITNFNADAEGYTTDKIVEKLLEIIPAKESSIETNPATAKAVS
jgi:MoxR-like ATPase